MFNIASITTDVGTTCILIGGLSGKEVISPHGPLGPQGSVYQLIFPGQGYINFKDVGNTVSGPGDWSVEFSGSSTNWFYRGEGQASINVKADGKYTVSGGSNTITGQMSTF